MDALVLTAQFLLNVYHFHTAVKSKYPELNHLKSGALYQIIEVSPSLPLIQ